MIGTPSRLALITALSVSNACMPPAAANPMPVEVGPPSSYFEPNRGQAPAEVRWLGRGSGGALYVTDRGLLLSAASSVGGASHLEMQLAGATPGSFTGIAPSSGVSHYYRGRDTSGWVRGVPHHARLRRAGVWPCVDLVLHASKGELEYDFVVMPGADPSVIQLRFPGADALALDAEGNLVAEAGGAAFVHRAPTLYQETSGRRSEVAGRFSVLGPDRVGFEVGAYDSGLELIIDPALRFSTFLGGSDADETAAVAVASDGDAIVAGTTTSLDFPTRGPAPPRSYDAYVARLDATGAALEWVAFFAGASADYGTAVAVDAAGRTILVGSTDSDDFPVTAGVFQGARAGMSDLFASILDPAGALVASSYLGGSSMDGAYTQRPPTTGAGGIAAVAVNGSGEVYIASNTLSPDFPTRTPFQSALGGSLDASVSKLDPTLTTLLWSTYLGGTGQDVATGIAIDGSGRVIAAGETWSGDFPVLAPLQAPSGQSDAFVTRFEPDGRSLSWSTWLGGNSIDAAAAVALDAAGNVLVAGTTSSVDFPVVGATQVFGGELDAFLTRLSASGHVILFSTFLGGSVFDSASDVAVDSRGRAVVVGTTSSADFPEVDPLGPPLGGGQDAFVTRLDASGATLDLSTYLGGESDENYVAVATGPGDDVYVAGSTWSVTAFPVTPGAFQGTAAGQGDAFVAAIASTGAPLLRITPGAGGKDGEVTVLVRRWGGPRFEPGAALRLVRSGFPTIVATGVEVAASGASLYADFDLTGAELGDWDVEVENPTFGRFALPGGFRVEPQRSGPVWVDLVGPSVIRVGRVTTFIVHFGTRGNVNLSGIPLWIGGADSGIELTAWSRFADTPLLPGQAPLDWSGFDDVLDLGGSNWLPVVVPRISPGVTGQAAISIEVGSPRTFELSALAGAPWFGGPLRPPAVDCWQTATRVETGKALADLLSTSLTAACEAAIRGDVEQHMNDLRAGGAGPPDARPPLFAMGRSLVVLSSDAGTCSDPAFATFSPAVLHPYAADGLHRILDPGTGFSECRSERGFEVSVRRTIEARVAYDPNEKSGALGVGPEQWIAGEEPLRWLLQFENQPSATLPAQDVVVSDALPLAELDLTTLQIGSFGLGEHYVAVEPGGNPLEGEIDLRPALDLVARVDAELDEATGLLRFRLRSIDPTTGRVTGDPLAGVLPPNQSAPEGQGFVSFTVRPKAGLATGTEVRNQASIVFDANAAIVTNTFHNTLDFDAPASAVDSLAGVQACSFDVSWSGSDLGSGLRDYNVFVAEDGGPWTLWLEHTTLGTAVFSGTPGHGYAFLSVARDRVGHEEAAPAVPDAAIFIDPAWAQTPASAGNALMLAKGSGTLLLRWAPLTYAASYLVLEATDKAGPFALESGRSATTSIELAMPGSNRLYRVAGVSACGNVGPH